MYMNTGQPRPWRIPKPASEDRLKAMVGQLVRNRELMLPHEYELLIIQVQKGLMPADFAKFQELLTQSSGENN